MDVGSNNCRYIILDSKNLLLIPYPYSCEYFRWLLKSGGRGLLVRHRHELSEMARLTLVKTERKEVTSSPFFVTPSPSEGSLFSPPPWKARRDFSLRSKRQSRGSPRESEGALWGRRPEQSERGRRPERSEGCLANARHNRAGGCHPDASTEESSRETPSRTLF